jgi:hypothetical protein
VEYNATSVYILFFNQFPLKPNSKFQPISGFKLVFIDLLV